LVASGHWTEAEMWRLNEKNKQSCGESVFAISEKQRPFSRCPLKSQVLT